MLASSVIPVLAIAFPNPNQTHTHLIRLERDLDPHLPRHRLALQRLQSAWISMWHDAGYGRRATHLYHWSTLCSCTSTGLISNVPRNPCVETARSYMLNVTVDASDVTSLRGVSVCATGSLRERDGQGDLVFPHRVVRRYAAKEALGPAHRLAADRAQRGESDR